MTNRVLRQFASLVLLVASLAAACPGRASDVAVIEEDFSGDKLSSEFEVQPNEAEIEGGFLTLKPKEGQQYLATTEAITFGSLTVEFQMLTPAEADGSIYYLGFQSVRPWAEDIAWVKIQENTLFVTLKSGEKVEEKLLAYLVPEQTYILQIDWAADRIAVLLDGKTVFETSNAELIPTHPLYPCFIANTMKLSKQGKGAELRLDRVALTKSNTQASVAPTPTQAEPLVQFDKSVVSDAGVKIQAKGATLTCESETTKYTFNLSGGISLAGIRDKVDGVEAIKGSLPGRLPLFRVNGAGLSLDASQFAVSDISAKTEGDAGVAEVSLLAQEQQLKGKLMLRLDADGRMRWKLSMTPESENINRLQLVFPIIGQIAIGGEAAENRFFFPQRTGIEGKASVDLTQEYGGGLAWMQVIGVHSPSHASRLTVFPMDAEGKYKALRFKKPNADGSVGKRWAEIIYQPEAPRQDVLKYQGPGIGMAWYYLRYPARPGQAVESPEISVFFGAGGWKETLADYSSWVRTWYQAPKPPMWFKGMANYWNVHPARFWSETEKRYKGTEVIGKEKVDVVQVFGWEDYADIPEIDTAFKSYQPGDFKINEARGGLKSLRAEIEKHHEKGIRYTVYTNIRFAYRGSEYGQKNGEQAVAMHSSGVKTMFGGDQVYCLSMYDDAWWQHMIGRFTQLIKETGMDGVYLDELGILYPDYNPAHAHWRELGLPQDTAAVARHMSELRDSIREVNPQAIVWTEHAGSDWFSQYNDGAWIQTFYSEQYEWVAQDFDDMSLYFFRFFFPEYVLAEWGPSRNGDKRCFFNGIGRDSGCGAKLDAILREQADAFASLKPEPAIPTLVDGLLANKFPIKGKTVVTLFNKSQEEARGDLISLPMSGKKNWKVTELVSGNTCDFRYDLASNSLVIASTVPASEVAALCIMEEP